jgi:drug/metabolite transporter (DMT)-like permease
MKGLLYTSVFSVCLPLLLIFVRRKNLSPYHIVLIMALCFAGASEGVSFYLHSNGLSNIPVINVYALIEFLVITVMYFYMFDQRKYWLRFLILLISFATYFVVDNVVIHNIHEYNGSSLTIATIVILTLSLLFYRELVLKLPAKFISKYSPFWINAAVCFYFAFSAVLFFASHYIFNSMPLESAWVFWSYHNVNNIVKNILFAVGIYYAKED